jgi:predicted nucleic acid-binding protein
MEEYKDFPLGFVDAGLVILAENHQITRILTVISQCNKED